MAHNSSGLIEQFFVKNNMYNMFICSLPELDAGLYAHDNSEARLREVLDQSREELRTELFKWKIRKLCLCFGDKSIFLIFDILNV